MLLASLPALARVLAPAVKLQLPGISERQGYWKAPHGGSAALLSLICFLERRRRPANLSGVTVTRQGLVRKSKVVKLQGLP